MKEMLYAMSGLELVDIITPIENLIKRHYRICEQETQEELTHLRDDETNLPSEEQELKKPARKK
jgi:hypothetical protein